MTEATPAPAPNAAYTAPVAENPGKTLGIVGLIVSIIALNKSKKAGYKNGLALAGIIISIISIVISIIVVIVIVSLGAAGLNAIAEVCAGYASGEVLTDGTTTITCP